MFADGTATPEAVIKYQITPGDVYAYARAGAGYKYPDSTEFTDDFPNGTQYKDKKSNWQTGLFKGLSYDK